MIARIINYIRFLKKINIVQFYYLNYFCKSVIRKDNSKIIPYKYSVIDIENMGEIIISKGDLEIGCDALKKSREETRIRIRTNGIWNVNGGCKISYGTTIEVLENATLNSKFFTMNSSCTMIVAKQVDIGRDVMIGRNVVIYDSDFHQISNKEGQIINYSMPVIIEDHVWLATNVMVMKGANVGNGSMIGANTIVNGEIPNNTMYYMKGIQVTKTNYGTWSRDKV